jgi:UPF0755 protein
MNRINNRNQNTGNGFVRSIFFLFVFAIFVGVGVFLWYNNAISAPLSNSNEVIAFNIERGEGRESIAKRLKEIGVIDNTDLFVWYTKISGEGAGIKAGSHKFEKNLNIKELVNVLEQAPDESTVWVTIPEGLRYDEIAEIVASEFEGKKDVVFSKNKFLEMSENPHSSNLNANVKQFLAEYLPAGKPIEGFLYPDTYNFYANSTTEDVFGTFVSTLISKVDTTELSNSNFSLYEILNIASMLEREAYTEDEARMISDIIIRRMELGYFLGIDATTLYEKKDWKAVLDYRDFETTSPYNTRKVMGLPPTPISNPSITTIEAVLNPKANEYLYYIHDTSNQIYYAKTNAEHEANVRKYL